MSAPARSSWRDAGERGHALGIALLAAVAHRLGRRAAGVILWGVAFWYLMFHPVARRASYTYFSRLRGCATWRDALRHFYGFARVTLDRLFFVRGDLRPFTIGMRGEEHLRALSDARRGALVVLAHLGSFEVLRGLAEERGLPLNVLGYFGNARRVSAALRRIAPGFDARLIEIRPNDPTFIFEVEACIARGELVGTMGDRVGFDGKVVHVPFLGAPAAFPSGPWLLASALRCPVLLAFGLYCEPNEYQLVCEPFAERVEIPRRGREAAVAAHAARYAQRLEHFCRATPYAWFNFYDFWKVA